MSVDKLVDSTQLDTDLTSVANAIRAKSGTSSMLLFPTDFISQISLIPSVRLKMYQKVTFTQTATQASPYTINLLPMTTGYYIFTVIDTAPTGPDASEYIALQWQILKVGSWTAQQTGIILRPNSTIGTDGAMCGYNASTGVFTMGGPYGHFMAGSTHHIYQFEIA